MPALLQRLSSTPPPTAASSTASASIFSCDSRLFLVSTSLLLLRILLLPHPPPLPPPLPRPLLCHIRLHLLPLPHNSAAHFLMQRTSWLHCADPEAAAGAAATALALFDDACSTGQADGVDEECAPQIIKLLLSSSSTASSSSDHIVDRLCSRITSVSAAATAAYSSPPSSPELPYWFACSSVCQWVVRSVIKCHLSPPPAATCPSPPFLLPPPPTSHINMPACVKVALLSFIQHYHSLSLPHRNPHPSFAMQELVAHVVAVARPRFQAQTLNHEHQHHL